jgi:pyruvate,water dikinase
MNTPAHTVDSLAAERAPIQKSEIDALRAIADPRGTVWSRYNLYEVLPEPTPMTWEIVRLLLGGRGGLGMMYRDLGCEPDPSLDHDSVFDLICGRPYCNLSREPLMQFGGLPWEHPFAELQRDASKAIFPHATFNSSRSDWIFWLRLPNVLFRLLRFAWRARQLSRVFPKMFDNRIVAFSRLIDEEATHDFQAISARDLLDGFQRWTHTTAVGFARDAFKPAALAGLAVGKLQSALQGSLGAERTRSALTELSHIMLREPDTHLIEALKDLASGRLDRATFFKRFGHRGNQEMELSIPRWSEDTGDLDRLPTFQDRGRPRTSWEQIANEAKLTGRQRNALKSVVNDLQTYLGLRETAKHWLMKGYALIRRYLLEIDRRFHLGGGIFYLKPIELSALAKAQDFSGLIAERQRTRALALTIDVPPVLFSNDLEAIGRPLEFPLAHRLQGVALSPGQSSGPALVLADPSTCDHPPDRFILVCPSSDPSWFALLSRAAGAVWETGGLLSHGGIVARELGIPAVAGIPGAARRFRTGQQVRVDGYTGVVEILSES